MEKPYSSPRERSSDERPVKIKLIGVGGAGSNAADRLQLAGLDHVQLAVVNTDSQALAGSPVGEKLLIGRGVTRGLSAGGDPELGRLAAESDRDDITGLVRNNELIILVAGMGGGTGSGAAPIVAEIASRSGALVLAFVTLPFTIEGSRRTRQGEDGLAALRAVADAVIPLPNDMLLQQSDEDTSVLDALSRGDEWIDRGVRSLWNMLHRNGLINLDFASLREVFTYRGGKTLFGLGYGEGDDSLAAALEDLRECPLLHTPEFSRKADRLLVNITGGPDLSLTGVQTAMTTVREAFGRDPHVTLGAVIDEAWTSRVEICVIGTTDIGGRTGRRIPDRSTRTKDAARRAAAAAVAKAEAAALQKETELELGEAAVSGRATPSQLPVTRNEPSRRAVPVQQEEFSFLTADQRGWFDHSTRALFEGEDLDIPTFRRRGIRIAF